MNFRSLDSETDDNLQMIKKFTEQYLEDGLTDKQFKTLCLSQIDEIIDRDLEVKGGREWIYWLLTKIARLFGVKK